MFPSNEWRPDTSDQLPLTILEEPALEESSPYARRDGASSYCLDDSPEEALSELSCFGQVRVRERTMLANPCSVRPSSSLLNPDYSTQINSYAL